LKKRRLKILILLTLFTGVLIGLNGFDQQVEITQIQNSSNTLGMRSDSPINITKNDDFEIYKSQGNGSLGNPYIIEDYMIGWVGSPGISISNTTAYFILRKCTVRETRCDGIRLYHVGNGTLEYNFLEANRHNGIHLCSSDYNTLMNNTCNGNYYRGIEIYQSDFNNIINNTLIDNSLVGFDIADSMNNNISHNIMNGIEMIDSENNIIDNNKIKNSSYGIYARGTSTNNQIINNLITNNVICGILLLSGSNYNVSGNTINNNGYYGIYINANYSWITWNIIHGNQECIGEYEENIGNVIENNDCGTVPGFEWIFALFGLIGILFYLAKRRQIVI